MERDFNLFVNILNKKISTHTLTWSVTSTSLLWHFSIVISTHTLTWSVTVYFIALAL